MSGSSCSLSGCIVPQDVEDQCRGSLITVINEEMLEEYPGDSIPAKLNTVIERENVVIIGWSHCPYCLDVRETLANELGIRVHVIETDQHAASSEIQKAVHLRTNSKRMPYCFIKGQTIGGCDDVRTLQASGKLETMLSGMIRKQQVPEMDTLEDTVKLPPIERGNAVMPLFWFPPTVNHVVVRLSGRICCILAITSVVFVYAFPALQWGEWIAAFLLGDFFLRVLSGASLSLIAQLAVLLTATKPPDLRPGPPKQFASACGLLFSLLATILYFTSMKIAGSVVCAMLALATGLEGFFDFCLGCFFFSKCIQYGIVPPYIYRVHAASRPELIATYKDTYQRSNTQAHAEPITTVSADPGCKIQLRYKIKSDVWIQNDFHVIRNMQAMYFAMPMSLASLAVALKLASDWGRSDLVPDASIPLRSIPIWWAGVFGILAAASFAVFSILYTIRLFRYHPKCIHEWDCPLRACHLGYVTTSLLLFSYLVYNWDGPLGLAASEMMAFCMAWFGSVSHTILVIGKIGEFVGLIHDAEHIHTTWLMLPIGSLVAAFVAPLVPILGDSSVKGNLLLAQFFYSFAFLMWVTIFIITFFKVVTTPNSNNTQRNTIFLWIAAPCSVGLANYSICFVTSNDGREQCGSELSRYYFASLMMLLCLAWATVPCINFFGRDFFSMNYWPVCFSFGLLASCAALFYGTNGYRSMEMFMLMALTVATGANSLALLHTLTAIRRQKIFTPTPKWGPLAFMKCTHQGIRGAIPKLRASLDQVNLLDSSNQGLHKFASLFAQFKLVHEEHSRHEDQVIFKVFSQYFPSHCKQYIQEHEDDEAKLVRWSRMIDTLLDPNGDASEKDTAFEHLVYNIPDFLDAQLLHLQQEEEHLQAIGKKYVPTTLQKQMIKDCFEITSSDRWEVMLPYVINNCSRHEQRIRYIKCLCWAMPERSQQFGAILYRHVDAVMWERLRVQVPEIIPRGEHNWRRYY
jgi:glutaredoxin 3